MSDSIWAALAEPRRRDILDVLRRAPCAVGELSERVGLAQPQTSKHLRVLRSAGLVTAHADAQRRIYRAEPNALAELDAWLAPYRAMWNTGLDRLGDFLDSNPDSPTEEQQ
ncbi:ArsR/SmtB family transcription factor [Aldersonia kunmingensis]|uniref:ArsR/SmtB family transcription factor n=1 Tax=Aldersonia kunmingensis TaxID=408066 RepID=UPI00083737B0|nr:metalloregulator ArsR/SmtB family transcription factor [Aldersonia kunmingensis]